MTAYIIAKHNGLIIRMALEESDDDLWIAIEKQYGREVHDLLDESDILDILEEENLYGWDLKFEPSDREYLAKFLAQ